MAPWRCRASKVGAVRPEAIALVAGLDLASLSRRRRSLSRRQRGLSWSRLWPRRIAPRLRTRLPSGLHHCLHPHSPPTSRPGTWRRTRSRQMLSRRRRSSSRRPLLTACRQKRVVHTNMDTHPIRSGMADMLRPAQPAIRPQTVVDALDPILYLLLASGGGVRRRLHNWGIPALLLQPAPVSTSSVFHEPPSTLIHSQAIH